MFDEEQDRYITRGIKHSLHPRLQFILWRQIEVARASVELDYLQIFRLRAGGEPGMQEIVHTQEKPEYRRELCVPAEEVVKEKVFVIDDGAYSTMLLAEEY